MGGPESFNFNNETKEKLPLSEYTFCSNHQELYKILAPSLSVALDEFEIRAERKFGSAEGDSVTSIPAKDVLI
jgi:hypothetical protein